MCDPITLLAAGTAISAAGQIKGGMDARRMGKAQRALANQQADEELDSARAEAEIIRRNAESARGGAVAGQAASGVRVGEGSALDAERKVAQVGEQDALMTILTGERRARALRAGGALQAKAGSNALTSSILGAGGTLLGGFGQYQRYQTAQGRIG